MFVGEMGSRSEFLPKLLADLVWPVDQVVRPSCLAKAPSEKGIFGSDVVSLMETLLEEISTWFASPGEKESALPFRGLECFDGALFVPQFSLRGHRTAHHHDELCFPPLRT